MKIGIYYASTSGNTETVTDLLVNCLGDDVADRHDIARTGFSDIEKYDLLIFGQPTWDYGQLQADWKAIWPELDGIDFRDRLVALYGLGDQYGYPDSYLNALGTLHDKLVEQGATIIGYWPNHGYDFAASKALTQSGAFFVGLALDEESQGHLTESRIATWCRQMMGEFNALGVRGS